MQPYQGLGEHNNINTFIERQLGSSGFDVVRKVHDNIQWLVHLYRSLEMFNRVSSDMHIIQDVRQYIKEIREVSFSLRDINELHRNLPLVNELAPRIKQFTQELEAVSCQIRQNVGMVNNLQELVVNSKKSFDDLYIAHKKELDKLTSQVEHRLDTKYKKMLCELNKSYKQTTELFNEIKHKLPAIEEAVKNQTTINLLLLHLQASDATTLAIETGEEADKCIAFEAIEESESYGNCEDINRKRLTIKRGEPV